MLERQFAAQRLIANGNRSLRRYLLLAGVAFLASGIGIASADAAEYTVHSLADSGPGTLRAALAASGSNPGKDRITFQPGLSGTIDVASNLPPAGEVEIVGPGVSEITVSGQSSHRLLQVRGDSAISGLTLADARSSCGAAGSSCDVGSALTIGDESDVSITDMIFENNRSDGGAGAVLAADEHTRLSVSNTLFHGNQTTENGGAISLAGPATVTDSTFTGNTAGAAGGAISQVGIGGGASGPFRVAGATFEGNAADLGGAIAVTPLRKFELENSTLTDNEAAETGGAIWVTSAGSAPVSVSGSTFNGNRTTASVDEDTGGGGLSVWSNGPVGIFNSTLVGNRTGGGGAGGALFLYFANATLDSLTVVGNTAAGPGSSGGGIYQRFEESRLVNSVVTGNEAGESPDLGGGMGLSDPADPHFAGSLATSFSLIGDTAGDAFVAEVPGSNQIGVDPELRPLADNGGPTETMLPRPSSPVVDKGGTALTVDQRGMPRPVDFPSVPSAIAAGANGADIGAVELSGPDDNGGPDDPGTDPGGGGPKPVVSPPRKAIPEGTGLFYKNRLFIRIRCPRGYRPKCVIRAQGITKKKKGKATTRAIRKGVKRGTWKKGGLLIKKKFRKRFRKFARTPHKRTAWVRLNVRSKKGKKKGKVFYHLRVKTWRAPAK